MLHQAVGILLLLFWICIQDLWMNAIRRYAAKSKAWATTGDRPGYLPPVVLASFAIIAVPIFYEYNFAKARDFRDFKIGDNVQVRPHGIVGSIKYTRRHESVIQYRDSFGVIRECVFPYKSLERL